MSVKKTTWKSMIIPKCCIPKIAFPESKKHVLKFTSFQKLFVEDLSFSLIINSNLQVFTVKELKVITQNFSSGNLIGEGGFGPVYKGLIDEKFRPGLVSQSVAVKSLDLEGLQGHKEWLAEIFFLGQHRHENLIKLIGCCCEDARKFLVYEYMSKGSLENQLFKGYSASLTWSIIRMKIALGAARGLACLHEAENPVIYRDLKASNILLDSDYSAKLSDFGLAKDAPKGKETHVSTSIMGTQGYVAPEYITTGHMTSMSDVYSFGVVLLELITGNRAMDRTRAIQDQSLVNWARPLLKDRRKIDRLIDPRLEGHFSTKAAQKVAALAYKCLSRGPKARPRMSEAVNVLEQLQDFDRHFVGPFVYVVSDGIEKDGKSVQCLTQNLHYIKTVST